MPTRALAPLLLTILCGWASAAENVELTDSENKVLPAISHLVKLAGDPENGKTKTMLCVMCHKVNGAGADFGPNLEGVGTRLTKDLIFQSILDPSAVIAPGYEWLNVKLEDEEVRGIKVSEDDNVLVLKQPGGLLKTINKPDILERTVLKVSAMTSIPNIQKTMTTQDLVDLVAYLSSLKKAP